MSFGNASLSIHLLRGLFGFAALLAAAWGHDRIGWPALLLLPAAVWALKGCPICWTIGLFETLASRIFRAADDEAPAAAESRCPEACTARQTQ